MRTSSHNLLVLLLSPLLGAAGPTTSPATVTSALQLLAKAREVAPTSASAWTADEVAAFAGDAAAEARLAEHLRAGLRADPSAEDFGVALQAVRHLARVGRRNDAKEIVARVMARLPDPKVTKVQPRPVPGTVPLPESVTKEIKGLTEMMEAMKNPNLHRGDASLAALCVGDEAGAVAALEPLEPGLRLHLLVAVLGEAERWEVPLTSSLRATPRAWWDALSPERRLGTVGGDYAIWLYNSGDVPGALALARSLPKPAHAATIFAFLADDALPDAKLREFAAEASDALEPNADQSGRAVELASRISIDVLDAHPHWRADEALFPLAVAAAGKLLATDPATKRAKGMLGYAAARLGHADWRAINAAAPLTYLHVMHLAAAGKLEDAEAVAAGLPADQKDDANDCLAAGYARAGKVAKAMRMLKAIPPGVSDYTAVDHVFRGIAQSKGDAEVERCAMQIADLNHRQYAYLGAAKEMLGYEEKFLLFSPLFEARSSHP